MNTNLKKVLLALASFALIVGAPACRKKDKTVTKEKTVTKSERHGRHHRDEKEGKKAKKHHKKVKKSKTVEMD